MDLPASTSELLNNTNYLDSNIPEDSGLRQTLQELFKIDSELTREVMMMDEDAVRTYFSENSKIFDAHSYINFVTGFHLINKEFARFLQPKQLCIRKF